jgi:hypothetical protein
MKSAQERNNIKRLVSELSKLVGNPQTPQEAGDQWEKRFIRIAKKQGYDATPAGRKGAPFDVVVCGFRVQCKMRLKRMPNGKVQLAYRTRDIRGANRRAYYRGEFDVLALRCENKTYLIPESALIAGGGDTLLNDIDPSGFASFVDNWEVFSGRGTVSSQTQLRLWGA